MFARICFDLKLSENIPEYLGWLSQEKRTRNNSASLNLLSVKNEFSKKSVYFSGAKLYNELPFQILVFDLKDSRRSETLLNFLMEILYKSFFK